MAPTACKRTVSGSISLPCSGFFSPFPHGTCSLSVSQEYLALADGAAGFRQDSSGPALLRVPLRLNCLPVRASHPLRTAFPDRSRSQYSTIPRPYYPGRAVTPPVWAPPRSLAATWGITFVFSSSGYLDVSVPRVRPRICGYLDRSRWVVPFGNLRITGYLHLPGAYRSLSRPSSPLRARASPVRS